MVLLLSTEPVVAWLSILDWVPVGANARVWIVVHPHEKKSHARGLKGLNDWANDFLWLICCVIMPLGRHPDTDAQLSLGSRDADSSISYDCNLGATAIHDRSITHYNKPGMM